MKIMFKRKQTKDVFTTNKYIFTSKLNCDVFAETLEQAGELCKESLQMGFLHNNIEAVVTVLNVSEEEIEIDVKSRYCLSLLSL